MTTTVPPGIEAFEQYITWLEDEPTISLDGEYETYYDDVLAAALRTIETSDAWQTLAVALPDIDGTFRLNTGFPLMTETRTVPPLKKKPYRSFLEKTFRKNVLGNSQYPDPPAGGWILPNGWFTQIRDLIRTTFLVRYLDGVQVLAEAFADHCDDGGIVHQVDFEARDEGYYAAHFLADFDCEIPRLDWDTEIRTMTFEVHIATQIQGVLQDLLHPQYEMRRLERGTDAVQLWQWDYDSTEFKLNYLGHISHYVDGMIVGLRNQPIGPTHETGSRHEG